jgi:ribonuclease D
MRYETIDDAAGLERMVGRLRGEPILGVDTEAAGYHRFFDRMSLLQLSTREENFLVDPLAVEDLSPLRELFEDAGVEKVFHDADYDLRILDRDAGMGIRGLFDTQIAAAFLGEKQLGLGSIVESYLGLKLPKEFQKADWAERPLSEGMMRYAATDTAHLPDLRDRLREALVERGRLHWAQEEFERREGTRWSEPDDGREAFMRIKGARDLAPRGLAILRELHAWRDGVARERDQATFRVLSNHAMLELSAAPRSGVDELSSVNGISPGLAQRRGRDILAAVRRGEAVPEAELPRWPRGQRFERDPEQEARVEALRDARSRIADRLGLDAGFLMARAALEEIARARPRTLDELAAVPGIRRWQVEAAGEELVAALRPR